MASIAAALAGVFGIASIWRGVDGELELELFLFGAAFTLLLVLLVYVRSVVVVFFLILLLSL